jgi:hypothetical protein
MPASMSSPASAARATALAAAALLLEPAQAFHAFPAWYRTAAGAASQGRSSIPWLPSPSRAATLLRACTRGPEDSDKAQQADGVPGVIPARAGGGGQGVKLADVDEKRQIKLLREALDKDNFYTDNFSPSEVSQDMTYEEWRSAFGDVIEPSVLRNVFDELDVDKNGKVVLHFHYLGLFPRYAFDLLSPAHPVGVTSSAGVHA